MIQIVRDPNTFKKRTKAVSSSETFQNPCVHVDYPLLVADDDVEGPCEMLCRCVADLEFFCVWVLLIRLFFIFFSPRNEVVDVWSWLIWRSTLTALMRTTPDV